MSKKIAGDGDAARIARLQNLRARFLKAKSARTISITGTLKQSRCSGADYVRFLEELRALLKKHNVEKHPFLNITIVRNDGKLTSIAKPDGAGQ